MVETINYYKTQGKWKIQLTIAINFFLFFFKIQKKRVLCILKVINREIVIGIERNEIIEELFDSLLQKYQKGVENKKATINPKNYGGKCFQYAITVALNHKDIKDLQRISKIKPFVNKYD